MHITSIYIVDFYSKHFFACESNIRSFKLKKLKILTSSANAIIFIKFKCVYFDVQIVARFSEGSPERMIVEIALSLKF